MLQSGVFQWRPAEAGRRRGLSLVCSSLVPVLRAAVFLGLCLGLGRAQSAPSPDPAQPRVTAPQVVTVVRRVRGLQALKLLREQNEGAIVGLENGSLLTSCFWVTNVTAGLVIGDGRSIMAYLPQAELFSAHASATPAAPGPARSRAARPAPAPRAAECRSSLAFNIVADNQSQIASFNMTDEAQGDEGNFWIVGSDGRNLRANYVGWDARTGLSLLQVAENIATAGKEAAQVGEQEQKLRVLSPQRVAATVPDNKVRLRLESLNASVRGVARTSLGQMTGLTLGGVPNFSPALVGGVAVNEQDETVGLVVATQTNQAQVLLAHSVNQAAARIKARRAAVPRAWLGVRAQDFNALAPEDRQRVFGAHAVLSDYFANFPPGVVLTEVLPGTPAAQAGLQTGDVVQQLNGQAVNSVNDLSFMLGQFNGGELVTLNLRRRVGTAAQFEPVELPVRLGETLFGEPRTPVASGQQGDLLAQTGLDSLSLSEAVAQSLGARYGRLILAVSENSIAANTGLLPGDIIETVNHQPLLDGRLTISAGPNGPLELVLQIVRRQKRLTFKLLLTLIAA